MDMELGVQDIAGAVAVIDACVKRGAFEGSEIGEVGGLRNRLAAFVNAAQQAQAQQAEQTEMDLETESE